MNSFTKKSMFKTDARTILEQSEILIKSDCVIYNDVLYERIHEHPTHNYRFFFDVDDYDYLENDELEKELDELF